MLLVIFIISSLSDKTDLISNFRIADLPGITDTDIPGNSAMTGKAKTAKHRREKEVKYRFYFNIPQGMLIVGATAVTASLPLQKRKDLCTTFWSLSLPRYVYIVTSSLSDKTD
ncbi:MAG: toxin-antitoxin system, toxin component [[Eubacterium] siraeum]|nr:toxin-antitoxin system, toxin component [Ruminiclostridium sp.]MBS6320756.1 toxin-antitoxin system, toxin component [[Eubacterium] siraeum]